MKKIGILASYNGSGFETIQKAIEDKILDAKVVEIIKNNRDRKSTRLNSSHLKLSRMPSSA